MKTTLHIMLLLLIPVAINAGTPDVSAELRVVEQLRNEGKDAEALAICDSLRSAMNKEFRLQYDDQVLPVRFEAKAKEVELEAQREHSKLMQNLCLLAVVLIIGGMLFYLFIRRENKRMSLSEKEMKQATDSAEMAEKSKSMFLSNMTHEIRAPLNAISGFADLLACEGIDDDTRREAADIIEMNSRMLQNLIDDVVETSCTDLRQMKFFVAPCNVVKLGRNVTEMIGRIKKTGADLRFEADCDELMVMTDSLRLQQVMVNVLVNATKFCTQGSIVMRVETDEKCARISVTDTGTGIPIEKQASIFGRFERVGEKTEGFGLGLSICKFIIEHMGGEIWVDGTYTGGARFIFTAPYDSVLPVMGEEDNSCDKEGGTA